MIQEQMTVVKNSSIALDTFEMVLTSNTIPQRANSGQFIHVEIGEGNEHMLRRPISIADLDQENGLITIIYKVMGEGTKWLSKREESNVLNVLGPLGNGFDLDHHVGDNILIVGGGVGVPPLYHVTKRLSQHNNVTAVLGFQSKEAVFYEKQFSQYAKTYIATDDGSYGHSGLVTDVINQLNEPFTTFYACGPNGMLKAVQNQLTYLEGYLSLEERMGCGIGACFACVCEYRSQKGYVKICQDGPVLKASEVLL
ncbi:dihydroorotate dehydrogenase electron transfer subunit [Alkalibacillus haloalkaliphilus]|uniref:Dihydroorotate dehydrogenase B (NAD(+)), electron transfer subunit n=1 Tax=Alkalibacillus haloalkaliphilus TaxID=94136 RepID=A0A511W198_9BACI|nr:dihydroorotate dehydrogenase electron transfer subunit [Alkalibacillus haloalkaliphilus]GEN44846.1 dihydroorotate dehydrogenase B (NAD(+)), electron transfer subunit [Alkalibacillus haloalkaliphilus]